MYRFHQTLFKYPSINRMIIGVLVCTGVLGASICINDMLVRGATRSNRVTVNSSVPVSDSTAYTDLMREVVLNTIYDPAIYKQDGSRFDRDSVAFTMMGKRRLNNIRELITAVVKEHVVGDILETGVWKGGGMFFAAAVLRSLGELGHRKVILCDSFAGIPAPIKGQKVVGKSDLNAHLIPLGYDNSQHQIMERWQRLLLPKDGIQLVPGYFNTSLPLLVSKQPALRLAVLRLDGDTYFSTMEALQSVYPHVSEGGYIIVDDYPGWEGCVAAIHDFRKQHTITDPLVTVFHENREQHNGVFWRKKHDPCQPLGMTTVKWQKRIDSNPVFAGQHRPESKLVHVEELRTGLVHLKAANAPLADVLHHCA